MVLGIEDLNVAICDLCYIGNEVDVNKLRYEEYLYGNVHQHRGR